MHCVLSQPLPACSCLQHLLSGILKLHAARACCMSRHLHLRRLVGLTVAVLLACTMASPQAAPVRFFGPSPEELFKLRSSMEREYDNYRMQLSLQMKSMQNILEHMGIVDEVLPTYRAVHDAWRQQMAQLPMCWEHNEVVSRILTSKYDLNPIISISSAAFSGLIPPADSSPSSYNSISQLFSHIARDWAPMGEIVRQKLYRQGIVRVVRNALSSEPLHGPILVPGAGLGRLATELAVAGFE
jgi:hypothetical protein